MNYTKLTLLIFITTICAGALSASSRATRRLVAIAGHIPSAHVSTPKTPAMPAPATATPTPPPSQPTKKTVANMSIDELLDDLTSDVHPLIKLYCSYKNNPCPETFNAFIMHVITVPDINAEIAQTRDKGTGKSIVGIVLEDNNLTILTALISAGYDVNRPDKDGLTALMWATHHENLSNIEYLVTHGAIINKADLCGCTALMWAIVHGHLAIVKYLVGQGAIINTADILGYTALMHAAERGHLDIVKYLVERGANINVTNEARYTALMIAQQYTRSRNAHIYKEIVTFLQNALAEQQKLAAEKAHYQALLKKSRRKLRWSPCYALHVIHSNL